MVRMNVDLLMGEDLKKTGASNLFTVFGEPDLRIEATVTWWSSTSTASTCTTPPPAKSVATTPTRSRSG